MPIFCESRLTSGGGRPRDVLAAAQLVDRDRGVVAVGHRPDDVLRPERRVAAEEHLRQRRLHTSPCRRPACPTRRIRCRSPARSTGTRFPGRSRPARRRTRSARRARRSASAGGGRCRRIARATFSNVMPVSLPFSCVNSFGTRIVEDRDALVRGVLLLPGRGLHLVEAGAHETFTSSPPSRWDAAAAVHRGVAAAQHDHAPADLRRCGRRTRWRASRCRCGCCAAASLRPGMSRSRPRGAPVPTNTAS